MRVATANSYDQTIAHLMQRQTELVAQQERISSGKRVQRASDDPVAAVLAETAQNRIARVQADLRALEASRTSLAQAESALGESGDLIQQARELMLSAGNPTLGERARADLALSLSGLREQMLALANRQDSAGRTLFGGLGGSSTPFVEVLGPSASGVRFDGLPGQAAAGKHSLPQALDGQAIWMRLPQGNGSFTISQAAGNSGGARTDIGRVSNPSALSGQHYSLSFAEVGGVMQYSVRNTSTASPVAGQTDMPFRAGSTVEFDGMAFQLHGNPAAGDRIEIAPVGGPTDIFQVLQNTMDALRYTGPAQGARLSHELARALTELDAGLDRVLQARSQAGDWLNRADSLQALLSDRSVAHQTEQARLEDLDMVQGISDFQRQQIGLDAALKSYAQVQRLSLFQHIG